MRLEHVCDMELVYRREALYDAPLAMIVPYGTQEGSLYGEGDGRVGGERLSGALRWVNHARRRSDGVNLPNTHGAIRTDDGATVLFTLEGRTQPALEGKRRQLLTALFEAQDERYRWLNDAVCVLEGTIDMGALAMRARVFACVHELA